jgi:hypothetical protein
MGRFEPADFSRGDPNTIGGYRAAHGRPPAFEGSDGTSYSVEVVADTTDDPLMPYAAYLLFVRWRASDPVAEGHLESDYIEIGGSEAEVIERLGRMPLQSAREQLERLIAARNPAPPAARNGRNS